jgi:hypothetical protein
LTTIRRVARNVTTADCDGCSTWPRCPAFAPTDPRAAFYDRKRAERLIHTQALLAVARRLIHVLWALLRDDREFTPEKPTAATAAA